MRRIYVFDEYGSSKQNGIGTYLRNLRLCLKEEAEVWMLSFNDDVSHITEQDLDGVHYIRFPQFCGGAFLANAEIGVALLRTMVDDKDGNIFVVNHFPCNKLLRLLGQYYPLSKRVFVIHDQRWNEALLGDEARLRKIISSSDKDADTDPMGNVIRSYVREETDMYEQADAVVCLNNGTKSLLRDVYHINPQKLFCIRNGADFSIDHRRKDTIRRNLHLREEDKVILYVGRTTEAKGIVAALQAMERLTRKHPEALLVVIGEVFRLNEFARLCPTAISRVVFAGHLNSQQIRDWYKAADVGLICSYREQCGYVGIEMMATGVPVVASDGGGIREMFRNGDNALVAGIGDRQKPRLYAKRLAHTLAEMIEADPKERNRLMRSGRQTYLEHFTLESMRCGYTQMIETVCSSTVNHSDTVISAPASPRPPLPNKETLLEVMLHCADTAGNGLLHGKMGVALSLAVYARRYQCPSAEDLADFLLHRIIGSLHRHGSISLGEGLAGIGWGIEFLVHYGFIQANTKDVCEEIDREIMRISPARIADLSLESGLEGILVYINAHLYSNSESLPFDTAYLQALGEFLRALLHKNVSTSFHRQAEIFFKVRDKQPCDIDFDLRQFVSSPVGDTRHTFGYGLHNGLAGKLVTYVQM